jgi:hypothetical protein
MAKGGQPNRRFYYTTNCPTQNILMEAKSMTQPILLMTVEWHRYFLRLKVVTQLFGSLVPARCLQHQGEQA